MRFTGPVVFITTMLLLAWLTHDAPHTAGSDASRLATIEALVDQGRTSIDESRYRWTVDRVTIDGREYSNKAPLFSLIGAAIYYPGRVLLGLDFEGAEPRTIWVLTLLLTGCATAWLAASFQAALGPERPVIRWMTTFALVAGTILTSFSATLNNHPLAAALLFAACRAALAGRGFAAGCWAGLTGCIDILPGAVFAPFLGAIVARQGGRKALGRYAVAALLGALLFVAANGLVVGSPLPPKMVPGAVDHTTDFGPAGPGVKINVPVRWFPEHWSMPLQALFGWRGFFSVSPVLLFGVAGLWVSLRRGGGPMSRHSCAMLAAAALVLAAGHLLLIGSFGGWSYGYRYLIPIVPLLLWFAPRVLHRAWVWLFAAALCVSVPLAWLGAYNPWPPLHEPEMKRADENPAVVGVDSPVGANLSGWLDEHFPRSRWFGRAAGAFIGDDPRSRARYLYLFHRSRDDDRAAIAVLRRYSSEFPSDLGARYELACALGAAGEVEEATSELLGLVGERPDFAPGRLGLGGLLAVTGRLDLAREQFEAALELRPGWPAAMHAVARLAATFPPEAALAGRPSAVMLDALALASAAAGRYDEAITIAGGAVRAALAERQGDLAASIRGRLELYRKRQPPREVAWDAAVGVAVAQSGR